MFTSTFLGLVAILYYACALLLAGLALFIVLKGGRHSHARTRLRYTFFLLALSLLLWQATLFLEVHTALAGAQLWLGRVNFAAVVLAASLAVRFVQAVAATGPKRKSALSRCLLAETALLAAVTLLTPLVDATERVEGEQAIATYGPLFPVYLLHVLGCLLVVLLLAFRYRWRTKDPAVRSQLALISSGMLATGLVAAVTNALLPYGYQDFRFCDVGALATFFFVLAVAYATFVQGLFDRRLMVRETLVFGLLLAFVLGTYSSTLFLVTQFLTGSAGKLTQFAVLLIAFSFDPLRRFLEKKTDRFLSGDQGAPSAGKKRRKRR